MLNLATWLKSVRLRDDSPESTSNTDQPTVIVQVQPVQVAPPATPAPIFHPQFHPRIRPTPASALQIILFTLLGRYPLSHSDPSDAIILTSEDGISFYTSRALLAAHSHVFATASAVSSPLTPSTDTEAVSLSSTPSAGLNILLAVLTILGTGSTTYTSLRRDEIKDLVERHRGSLSAADLLAIGEALECARIFDMTSFERDFVRNALHSLTDLDDVVGFTLLAITSCSAQAGLGAYASKLLKRGTVQLPAQAARILAKFAPEHIDRYSQLHVRYKYAYTALQRDLSMIEPMTDKGRDEYAKQCQGLEVQRHNLPPRVYGERVVRKYRPACAAFLGQPRWVVLRHEAADKVFGQVQMNGKGPFNYDTILPIVQQKVPCAKCAARLTRTFEVAVKRFRAVAESY